MAGDTPRRRRGSRGPEAEEAPTQAVEISDLLRHLNPTTVGLVLRSLPAGAREVKASNAAPSASEGGARAPALDAANAAAPPESLKSDALSVAVYVHRMVAPGDEGGSAQVADAVQELDFVLKDLDDAIKKTVMLSRGRSSARRREPLGLEGGSDNGRGARASSSATPSEDLPALASLLFLLGKEGAKDGRCRREPDPSEERTRNENGDEEAERMLLQVLRDSDEESEAGEGRGQEALAGGAVGVFPPNEADIDGALLIEKAKEEIDALHAETTHLQTEIDALYNGVEDEIRVASRLLFVEQVLRAALQFLSAFTLLQKESDAATRASRVQKLLSLLHAEHAPPSETATAELPWGALEEKGETRASQAAKSAKGKKSTLALADLRTLAPLVSRVQKEAVHLRTAARHQLLEALETLSSLGLASALDVFCLLGQLWEQVEALLRNLVSGVCTAFPIKPLQAEASKVPPPAPASGSFAYSSSLDASGKSIPPCLSRNRFEKKLTEEVEAFFARLEDRLKRASLADQVLAVGADPVTHCPYTAVLASSGFRSTLSEEAWRASSLHLSGFLRQLAGFASPSTALLSLFERETAARDYRRRRARRRAEEGARSAEEESEGGLSAEGSGAPGRRESEEDPAEREKEINIFTDALAPPQLAVVDATPLVTFLIRSFLRRIDDVARAGALAKAPSETQRGVLLAATSPLRQVYVHLFAARLDALLASLFSPKCLSQLRLFLWRSSLPLASSLLLLPLASFASEAAETRRDGLRDLLRALDPIAHLPSSHDIHAFMATAFQELERARSSTDAELLEQVLDVFEDALDAFILLCGCQLGDGVETVDFVDPSGDRLLRRLPPASPARVRLSKVFALFVGIEDALRSCFERNPHLLLLLLRVPFAGCLSAVPPRREQVLYIASQFLCLAQRVPESGEGPCEEAEEEDDWLLCGVFENEKQLPLARWSTFRDAVAFKRRLVAPLFASIESAAAGVCLSRLSEEISLALAGGVAEGSRGAPERDPRGAEDVEHLAPLCELDRLLRHAQQQFLSLLPPPALVTPLSNLCLSILETLLGHACACDVSEESDRAFVAAVVARGEVLLSAFWASFHKHVRSGSEMLRNVRRLLFADTPFLLHELLEVLTQSGGLSASPASSPLVSTSLPPLLVACHLLWRLAAHRRAPALRPHVLLGLPGASGLRDLARLLALALRAFRPAEGPLKGDGERAEQAAARAAEEARRALRKRLAAAVAQLEGRPPAEGEVDAETPRAPAGRGGRLRERRRRDDARREEELRILLRVARLLHDALQTARGGRAEAATPIRREDALPSSPSANHAAAAAPPRPAPPLDAAGSLPCDAQPLQPPPQLPLQPPQHRLAGEASCPAEREAQRPLGGAETCEAARLSLSGARAAASPFAAAAASPTPPFPAQTLPPQAAVADGAMGGAVALFLNPETRENGCADAAESCSRVALAAELCGGARHAGGGGFEPRGGAWRAREAGREADADQSGSLAARPTLPPPPPLPPMI
ncbi:hypothetical protein BESB_028790 [Besnoitia besnoiti]|uniref:Conserved oligomeric Golgi complex subunit 5 helical domain-containing protein n=1 Tax=Besnoitia besnoiti TaxID=94643 RepID=A0A2A9M2I4_BESBE|nr:uncharacterized protein BESB_028790 [Besnoitia besnoiti]PFH31444.1 hypothetical protein BESB_028790 [Besnoitia besnoiti]